MKTYNIYDQQNRPVEDYYNLEELTAKELLKLLAIAKWGVNYISFSRDNKFFVSKDIGFYYAKQNEDETEVNQKYKRLIVV